MALAPSYSFEEICETPGGAIDCVNQSFTLSNRICEHSLLKVTLDGVIIDPDFVTVGLDLQSFTLSLNKAPQKNEVLRAYYVPDC